MKEQNVVVLVGIPGSGKTVWAQRYTREYPNTVIVSSDMYRRMFTGKYVYDEERMEYLVKSSALQTIVVALDHGFDVIYDECNLTRKERDSFRHYCLNNVVARRLIWTMVEFFPNSQTVNRRLEERRGYSTKNWEKVREELIKKFEPVWEDECTTLIKVG